jgi:hypothetical protein
MTKLLHASAVEKVVRSASANASARSRDGLCAEAIDGVYTHILAAIAELPDALGEPVAYQARSRYSNESLWRPWISCTKEIFESGIGKRVDDWELRALYAPKEQTEK